MAVRDIVQARREQGIVISDGLGRTADRVIAFDDSLLELVRDLRETMWSYRICIGLAASQIGDLRRVAVLNPERADPAADIVLVNPQIVSTSGKKDLKRESCMSLWGLAGEVERRDKVAIEYFDLNGNKIDAVFGGFAARVVMHEIDHLDGVLYCDKLREGAELYETDLFATERGPIANVDLD